MGAGSLPYGVIREVWKAVWGDDVTVAKRSAANQHRVRCPYHDDRSPSCDVNLAKNTFYCRSCEAQGGLAEVVIRAGNAHTRAQAFDWIKAHGIAL